MTEQLSEATKAVIRATVPALATHGTAITAAMYKRLFKNEHVRELFNQSNQGEDGRQTKALAHAVLAYAQHIDDLSALAGAVERIAQKHAGLNILPEHYPHVAEALLGAIAEILGDAASEEVLSAWGKAFWFLADILIGREKEIYTTLETADGGWTGWREFEVVAKRAESDIITSLILRPADGGAVVPHRPGQYLTFGIEIDGSVHRRNYSISCAPNDESYRISVKREPGGLISNHLHDTVQVGSVLRVGPPAGDFHLPDDLERPIVLLSGGVGLTPMVSMLESAATRKGVSVHYVHGAENGRVHAMGDHIRRITESRRDLHSAIFYRKPQNDDRKGEDYDHEGLITVDWLAQNTPLKEADFYLCGPKPFLSTFVSGLRNAGVTDKQIHYEFFGPADQLG